MTNVGGMPVVSAVDAWVQLAPTLSIDDLVTAGDALVRRKRPITTIDGLTVRVSTAAGSRGIRSLRAALDLIRPGTDSPPESQLRLLLVRAGLPEPLVRHAVHHDGYFVGTPDLAYPVERVALECEGEVHATDVQTFRDDIERRERFEDAGWRVIRVTADHLRNPVALLARVTYILGTRR